MSKETMNETAITEVWYYERAWTEFCWEIEEVPVIEFCNEATGVCAVLYCRSLVDPVCYTVATGQIMYTSDYMSTKNFGDAVAIARQYCERGIQ